MKVLLVQPELVWEDPQANRDHIDSLIRKYNDIAEMIFLPETFTTGFTMNTEKWAEEQGGPTFQWMRNLALKYNSTVSGSLIIKQEDCYYNRLIWVNPDGDSYSYDKRHLFSMGDEDKKFTPGSKHQLILYNNWKIMPLICYDLRFPVWSRNTSSFDLLVYHANWPAVRQEVWEILLRARAIENQCYVIGINRVGKDGRGMNHLGGSTVIDPKGRLILHMGEKEGVGIASLNLEELYDFRDKFPALRDRDEFRIL